MNFQRRTDLAAELSLSDRSGIREKQENQDGFAVSTVEILTAEAEKRLGKPRGKYITVSVGRIWLSDDAAAESAALLLADRLKLLANELCGGMPDSVLVAGLGNRHITADALGDQTVGLLTATRHLKTRHSSLFGLLGGREISAIAPGVLGQTGMEAAEVITGVCGEVRPELIVAVDSLCARSTERLAVTVQLGSTGITPGSGIGNHRRSITKEALGVPVIALGVPTVVDSATLVLDALEEAGITDPDPCLMEVLKNRRGYFVTPKETDTIIREVARLLARSLTLAFGGSA